MMVRLSHKEFPPGPARTIHASIDLVASGHAAVDGAPTTILLVLDTSRSMVGEGIEAVGNSIRHWVAQLRPEDRIGILTFGSYPTTQLEVTGKDMLRQDTVDTIIGNLKPDGSTNLHMALEEAADLIGPKDKNIRYVLVTDGRPTDVEEPEGYRGMAERLKGQGAVVDCLGIGEEYNEAVLSALVDNTGGLWSHVSDPAALETAVDVHIKRATQVVDDAHDLHIKLHPGVRLGGLYEYRPAIRRLPHDRQDEEHVVAVPPLSSGEKRTIVLALQAQRDEPANVDLMTVRVGDGEGRTVSVACIEGANPHGDDSVPRGLYEVSKTQVMAMSADPAEREAARTELKELEADPALTKLNEVRERIDRSLTMVQSSKTTRADIHRAKTVVKVD